ncbi:pantoate--beta-alanine ligase [Staphylococcus aureus]
MRIVSVFVNGLEFGGKEDLDGYGREIDKDLELV